MIELSLRQGSVADEAEVLALFDEAVRWLVARGLDGQWGSEPFSAHPEGRSLVSRTLRENEVWVAEHEGETVGVMAVGSSPPYVPGNPVPELYIVLLISSRRHAGQRIGSRLLETAAEMARARGARMLRVDCWADSADLIRFYEAHGFTRHGPFDLRGWRGQVLGRML